MICKTPSKSFSNTLANTIFISREKPPSLWEILFMIPVNIVYPFLYIMDIVKDLVQFALLVLAVGGFSKFFEYWSSFSSTVSKHIFIKDNFLYQIWVKPNVRSVKNDTKRSSAWYVWGKNIATSTDLFTDFNLNFPLKWALLRFGTRTVCL